MKIFYQLDNLFFNSLEENFNKNEVFCIDSGDWEYNSIINYERNVIDDTFGILSYCIMGIITADIWRNKKEINDCLKDKVISAIGNDKEVVILINDFYNFSFLRFFYSIKSELNLHLNIIVLINENFKSDTYYQLLRKIENLESYSSVCIINYNRLLKNNHIYTQNIDREICFTISEIIKNISNSDNKFKIYNHKSREYEKFDIPQICFQFSRNRFDFYEIVALGHDKKFCERLKEYRINFAKNHNIEYTPLECSYKGKCKGTCFNCERESHNLFIKAYNKKIKNKKQKIMINGIERLRENTDGSGIRSLVLTGGCPLNCKYCGNAEYKDIFIGSKEFSVSELGERIKKDGIYFEESGGGVTFGGGEPLLSSEFIFEFCKIYDMWNVDIETSLNADFCHVQRLVECIDVWHIDIKDMNPDIYISYTGNDNSRVISNLNFLIKKVSPEKLHIRVPEIPDFNSESDIKKSVEALRKMGFTNIEIFKYKI